MNLKKYYIILLGDTRFQEELREELHILFLLYGLDPHESCISVTCYQKELPTDGQGCVGIFFCSPNRKDFSLEESYIKKELIKRNIPILAIVPNGYAFEDMAPQILELDNGAKIHYPDNLCEMLGDYACQLADNIQEKKKLHDLIAKYEKQQEHERSEKNMQIKDLAYRIMELFGIAKEHRNIFISYFQHDSAAMAEQLFDELNRRGYHVFLDRYSMKGGILFQERVRDELSNTDMVLLIDSDGISQSHWCFQELLQIELQSKPVIFISWNYPGREIQKNKAQDLFNDCLTVDESMKIPECDLILSMRRIIGREENIFYELNEKRLLKICNWVRDLHPQLISSLLKRRSMAVETSIPKNTKKIGIFREGMLLIDETQEENKYLVLPYIPNSDDIFTFQDTYPAYSSAKIYCDTYAITHKHRKYLEKILNSFCMSLIEVNARRSGSIFISASYVDDSQLGEGGYKSIDRIALKRSIQALVYCYSIFYTEGYIIFGGHPSINLFIYTIARSLSITSRVKIYQSEFFDGSIPSDAYLFRDTGGQDCFCKIPVNKQQPNNRAAALLDMRKAMLKDCDNYVAAFFMGGKQGVEEEYALFRGQETIPLIPLKVTGGASDRLTSYNINMEHDSIENDNGCFSKQIDFFVYFKNVFQAIMNTHE